MHHKSPFWDLKSKKISGEGAVPPPQAHPPVGRGHPLPTPYPLGAFGASIPPPKYIWIDAAVCDCSDDSEKDNTYDVL